MFRSGMIVQLNLILWCSECTWDADKAFAADAFFLAPAFFAKGFAGFCAKRTVIGIDLQCARRTTADTSFA